MPKAFALGLTLFLTGLTTGAALLAYKFNDMYDVGLFGTLTVVNLLAYVVVRADKKR